MFMLIIFYLHWLPIEFRINTKFSFVVYKSLHGEGPEYLASLLEEYEPPRALRSASQHRLKEVRTKKKYGERAFSVIGPKLWNNLPMELKNKKSTNSFKTSLKTHLFRQAYNL